MGKHHYTKDVKVTFDNQGQRQPYYDDSRGGHRGRGGSVNRVWRKGDDSRNRRVSFNDRGGGGGAISKKRGGTRPRVDSSRLAALLEDDEDMRGSSSGQAGRARPAIRGLGGKFRGGRGARGGRRDFDLSRFRSFEPLSDEHKATLQEAMNARYVPESKALDLKNFKADNKFGGSSKANGDLKNPKVMEFVLDTIGQHLSHLEALNLSNNGLRRLQPFSKIVDKAPGLRILYLEDNELLHSDELKCISQLPLVEIKLSGNPFVGKFSDGAHYARVVQTKIKSVQVLDGNRLAKLITFEEDEAGHSGGSSIRSQDLPTAKEMSVNPEAGDFIRRFVQQYFITYDSDNRGDLAMAYHENAMMSMAVNFHRGVDDEIAQEYKAESRNLNIREATGTVAKRDRLLHRKRLQIVGFLDRLPKTQHDTSSFTLDIPFATERLMTFTVTGAFRERLPVAAPKRNYNIRHFSRTFVVVPQGEGLCIINDTLCITTPSRQQAEKSTALFTLSEETQMNITYSEMCLANAEWSLDKARQDFQVAKQEGKIPQDAFTK